MLVTMKTSWRRHRPHALANLAFRICAAGGFGVGLLYAITRATPGTPSCNIEKAACVTRLMRYEAVFHVGPPVAGLIIGVALGAWLARGVLRHHRGARIA
jgi:hypothetical protein